MEQEVFRLLNDTQSSDDGPRRNAEAQLESLHGHEAYPIALINIAVESSLQFPHRTQALLLLKNWVLACWSQINEEWKGPQCSEDVKQEVRKRLFPLVTNQERKIRTAAAYALSKIASSDYPEEWPSLLPDLIQYVKFENADAAHGALRVIRDMVEDSFSDEQFFRVAKELVQVLYDTAINESQPANIRSIAVSVFRSCLEILLMVSDDHEDEVKGFLQTIMEVWVPFFVKELDVPLSSVEQEHRQGSITLKFQVTRTLLKIRHEFPQFLLPFIQQVFSSVWTELKGVRDTYVHQFVDGDEPGRLEDSDQLSYTLDLLVLEELDLLQTCIVVGPIKSAIQSADGKALVEELIHTAITLAQITSEEEDIWNIDTSIFLAEESEVTNNYSARTTSGDLIMKLVGWMSELVAHTTWNFTQQIFQTGNRKIKEAALFIWNQLLYEWEGSESPLDPTIASGLVQYIRQAIESSGSDEVFLRARGYLLAGKLASASPETFGDEIQALLLKTIKAVIDDDSEVVQCGCIYILKDYCENLSPEIVAIHQKDIISSIGTYVNKTLREDAVEKEDELQIINQTLRAAISVNYNVVIEPDSRVLNFLFEIALMSEDQYYVSTWIADTLDDICDELSGLIVSLSQKLIPLINNCLDTPLDPTTENMKIRFGTNVLCSLCKGDDPLPDEFIPIIVPRLSRLLLSSEDSEILQPGCEALQYIVHRNHKQLLEWCDADGKSGLENVLFIIDRLLGPTTTDNMALEVGGLAAEVVEIFSGNLGPFLPNLLRAVAARLSVATTHTMIQSLVLVFARLCINQAKDVVDFLSSIELNGENGLQSVLRQWLSNSEYFSGYAEIRNNVMALTRLFTLNDPRLHAVTVQGDLIVGKSTRIMTRSQTKNNPQRYTQISVPVKIIKLLIKELSPMMDGVAVNQGLVASGAARHDESDEEWEDLEDIGFPGTKKDIMAMLEEDGRNRRIRDDETNEYLVNFFKQIYTENIGNFRDIVENLTQEERSTLQSLQA